MVEEETQLQVEQVFFRDLLIVLIVVQSFTFVHLKAYLKIKSSSVVLHIKIIPEVVPFTLYEMWCLNKLSLKLYKR